jgi:hypothetical protein
MTSLNKKHDLNNSKLDYIPSHNMTSKYAVLQEVNDKEMETWLYFIKYDGNENNLNHLKEQLESIDWYIIEDCSTFDIDLEHLVSAQTAKEMTKIELNAYRWHSKFDGSLDKIDFGFKKKDDNDTKIIKVFDMLAYGQIEDYIGDEDIDEEDLTDTEQGDEEFDIDSEHSSESEDESDESDRSRSPMKEVKKIPPSLFKKNKK